MRNSAGRKHSRTRPSVFTPPDYVWLWNLSENSLLFPLWSAGFSVEAQRGRHRCRCCCCYCCRTQSPRWLLPLRHRGAAKRGGGVPEEEGVVGVLYKKRLSLRCKSGRQGFSLKKMLVLRRRMSRRERNKVCACASQLFRRHKVRFPAECNLQDRPMMIMTHSGSE